MGSAAAIDPLFIGGMSAGGEFSIAFIPGLNRWVLLCGEELLRSSRRSRRGGRLCPSVPSTHRPCNRRIHFRRVAAFYGNYIIEQFSEWDVEGDIASDIHDYVNFSQPRARCMACCFCN